MLQSLQVKNYALIKSLHFSPSEKLNTITGETGAGKSIMLGALGLILGQRADTKSLLDDSEKCIIEGTFNLAAYKIESFFKENDLDYEAISTVRREIAPSGKSRAFINDTPTTLDVLKELGEQLVDIHSQHDTLFLKKNNFQLELIDAFADTTLELSAYQTGFSYYSNLKKELEKVKSSAENFKSELDYNSFLLNELEELNPQVGEEASLEQEMQLIDNAELIKTNLIQSNQLLDNPDTGATNFLYEAITSLKQIQHLSPAYAKLYERLLSSQTEIQDLAQELESENEAIEYDAARAEELKTRYDKLQRLLLKHHVESAQELIAIQDDLAEKVAKVTNLDDHILALEKQVAQTKEEALAFAKQLSDKRIASFEALASKIQELVAQLGMPEAKIHIQRNESGLTATGIDDIALLFSANKGIAPVTLKQAASGGEMSRLVFAIKYIMADKMALPTIIFDEIDTGISGEIALQMGKMMQQMAQNHQVIAITHLPQIASKGAMHFYVYKDTTSDKTMSAMRVLDAADRTKELAEMIGGKNPSESAFASARELLGA